MRLNDIKITVDDVSSKSFSSRSCGECSKCCEGWLPGEAYGHTYYRGKPCFFLNKNCTIYEFRPDTKNSPCRTFNCEWLSQDLFPHWMKPNLSNVIITKRQVQGIQYYYIVETDVVINAMTLNWLIRWAFETKNNILYFIQGGQHRLGSKEFLEVKLHNYEP
jgi:hypothetical protein